MILTQIEVIHNVTVDVTPQYRWLGASFLLATVYSVRPAAGVISLCRVVCRQNRGFGSILDTGITCLSWSSPQHGATPNPPPLTPDLTTVYRVSLELSLCVERSQNRHFPTTPDTWSRPFGTCICFTCWDQSFFPNLLFLRTMLFEYPSVLSRFCLFLLQTIWIKLKEILKKMKHVFGWFVAVWFR